VNAELDRYLLELSALEFAIDTSALSRFSLHLNAVNSEIERVCCCVQRLSAVILRYRLKQEYPLCA
jgi:hypothetical protein